LHGGPAQDIRIDGNSLRFRVVAGDADLMFTGHLYNGRLQGTLVAIGNGRHASFGPMGKKLGDGTWDMSPGHAVQEVVSVSRLSRT
jgi:hypothetical protein